MTSPVTCVMTSRGHPTLPAWRDKSVVVGALKRRHRRISVLHISVLPYPNISYIPRISCHCTTLVVRVGCVIYPLYWQSTVKSIVCVHSIILSTLFLAQSKFLCFHLFQIKQSFALLLLQFQLSVWYFCSLEVFCECSMENVFCVFVLPLFNCFGAWSELELFLIVSYCWHEKLWRHTLLVPGIRSLCVPVLCVVFTHVSHAVTNHITETR